MTVGHIQGELSGQKIRITASLGNANVYILIYSLAQTVPNKSPVKWNIQTEL